MHVINADHEYFVGNMLLNYNRVSLLVYVQPIKLVFNIQDSFGLNNGANMVFFNNPKQYTKSDGKWLFCIKIEYFLNIFSVMQ